MKKNIKLVVVVLLTYCFSANQLFASPTPEDLDADMQYQLQQTLEIDALSKGEPIGNTQDSCPIDSSCPKDTGGDFPPMDIPGGTVPPPPKDGNNP